MSRLFDLFTLICAISAVCLGAIYLAEFLSALVQRRNSPARTLTRLLSTNRVIEPQREIKTVCAGCNADISAGCQCRCLPFEISKQGATR